MTTIVGIKTKDGVVLSSDKRASKGFFIGSKITQKILKVDETIAVAIAGQVSDAEYLVNAVRAERTLVGLQRGYPLTVRETAKLIANIAYQGMKNYQPYFAEFIVGGVDQTGPHVFESDMSGAISTERRARISHMQTSPLLTLRQRWWPGSRWRGIPPRSLL